jgi:hypothetical protein
MKNPNWKILKDNGFAYLENGFWIREGQDPNQGRWLTENEALEASEAKKVSDRNWEMINANEVSNVDDAMGFLTQRYQLSTNIEAKCIKFLIKYIADNQAKEK